MHNSNDYVYTHQLRKDLYHSLIKRFGDFIEKDCFRLATYLDPILGPKAFPVELRSNVKQRLKYHIGLLNPQLIASTTITSLEANANKCSSNYTFYSEPIKHLENFDEMDACIEKYNVLANETNCTNTLLFWKLHENSLPLLAPLAKKFLGVPASSASVERMFNISGHVFSNKRRRTGVKLFENLVFLKLNEKYL